MVKKGYWPWTHNTPATRQTSSRELQQRDDKRRRKKKRILGFLFWVVTFYRALGTVNMESLEGRTLGWIPKCHFPCCGCLFTWSFPVLKFSSCKKKTKSTPICMPCAVLRVFWVQWVPMKCSGFWLTLKHGWSWFSFTGAQCEEQEEMWFLPSGPAVGWFQLDPAIYLVGWFKRNDIILLCCSLKVSLKARARRLKINTWNASMF